MPAVINTYGRLTNSIFSLTTLLVHLFSIALVFEGYCIMVSLADIGTERRGREAYVDSGDKEEDRFEIGDTKALSGYKQDRH